MSADARNFGVSDFEAGFGFVFKRIYGFFSEINSWTFPELMLI
jgi:hypothetical protein